MFQFPSFPAHGYGFTMGFQGTTPGAFPHLRHLRIKACLATPRSFSQLCHVFHRLSTPKHPPWTLSYLVLIFYALDLDHTFLPDFQRPALRNTPAKPPSLSVQGVVEATGLEPVTFALQTQCSSN